MRRWFSVITGFLSLGGSAWADEFLYRYEADVLPYDPSAGWIASECAYPCSERLENGHFILHWDFANDHVQYRHRFTVPPQQDPQSLWVEWRFRSNHAFPWHTYSCDAGFMVDYASIEELINTYGDAVISFGGDDVLCCFELNEFHTFRFESTDGVSYFLAVDGMPFLSGTGFQYNGYSSVFFSARGGCIGDEVIDLENAWDFVRYGTISYGEQIVGSDPPAGFLNARVHVGLDRFTVTYDEPNYVLVDEIDVTVVADPPLSPVGKGGGPVVTATGRRDNGPPDEVEIVLDRPIPFNATTTFTFDDGVAVNVVEYTFAPGDTDGDGDADLADYAYLQSCPAESPLTSGPCLVLDGDGNGTITPADSAGFTMIMSGPSE